MTTPSQLLSGILVFLTALNGAYAQDAATRGPRPELDPPQVVEAMLGAMKKNSDQGIAELYRFSSPRNRVQTGSLESFAALMRAGFPDLLGHRAARIAPALIDGNRAMLPVEVQARDGQLSRYIFLLSLQSIPECQGCWMADAVFSPEGEGAPQPGGEAPPEYGV